MTKLMKQHLEAVVTAIVNEDTAAAKDSFHNYLRLKTQSILLGEEADDKDEDCDDDMDDDNAEDKDDKPAFPKKGKKEDKSDKKEDKSDKKEDKKEKKEEKPTFPKKDKKDDKKDED